MIIKIDKLVRAISGFHVGCFVALVTMGLLFFSGGVARADILDDFKNSTMTGYIIGGEATSLVESITIFKPEKQEILGVPFTFGRYKLSLIDGKNVVDDVLLVGHIGNYDPAKNNTWYLYLRKIDEPFSTGSIGILYDAARHWLGEDAPPVYIGAGVMEGGELMYSLLAEWEFTPGYLVYADVYVGMESPTNRNFVEGKAGFKKNQDPEGKTYIDAFIQNVGGNSYLGVGIGYTL